MYKDTSTGKVLLLQLQRRDAAGSGSNPLLLTSPCFPHVFIFKLGRGTNEALLFSLCPQLLISLPALFQQKHLCRHEVTHIQTGRWG